ncbi:MAG: UvrD-helicase domain-containing protein, partial [Chloroflexi bacterium]|nr:UvrD-helicase domain-containing protein [Chloroflexota bacterium]
NKALDFDDLLMKTVELFRKSPEVLARYQSRYHHLLVDEFQDTNIVQYELIKQLGGKYRNICVVGDPDQSIYSWRFADLRNILSFEKDYPDAKVVLLEQNYRSTQKILEAASSIISVNQQRKAKSLWTENEPGEPATIVETYNEQEEARFVISEIERLVSDGEFSLKDFAVMFRTNAQSRALEEAFIRYGTAYRLVAATRFYERREVKDVAAYLRFIQNPRDSVSLTRIINTPQRGIGQQSQARLAAWAKSMGISQWEALQTLSKPGSASESPFSPQTARLLTAFTNQMAEFIARSRELKLVDLFDIVVERSGYKRYILSEPDGEERWENVLELRTVAQDYDHIPPPEGLSAFLEGVTLVSDVDELDASVSAVTLITLHQAKGLEFPVVFMVGMEDGILPHFRSFDDPAQMEEERRLCYVGITRARQKLYMVRAFRRNLMGRSMVSQPSRFLADLPRHLVATGDNRTGEESQIVPSIYSWNKAPAAAPAPDRPTLELKAGDKVRHDQFGHGVVVNYQPVKNDAEVTIAFSGAVKKLLLSFARLEKVG